MVKVVIVNGMPESGKTTFQELCSKICSQYVTEYNVIIKSSVEWVKEIANVCGWDGTKSDKNRKFLSDLKRLLTDWDDAVLKNLDDTIRHYHYSQHDFIVFVDIREPLEIERAKKLFNATTVLVRRPQVEANQYSNESDMDVFNYNYDYTVWNDKEMEWLLEEADSFIMNEIIPSDKIYTPKGEKE